MIYTQNSILDMDADRLNEHFYGKRVRVTTQHLETGERGVVEGEVTSIILSYPNPIGNGEMLPANVVVDDETSIRVDQIHSIELL